jgi:hypothetical protein
MKKGDITIQMVVLAALALIFLIVVVFVMTGKLKIFSTTLDDCTNKDGMCVNTGTCDAEGGSASSFSCPTGQECCLNLCKNKGGTCEKKCSSEQIYFAGCPSGQECCR